MKQVELSRGETKQVVWTEEHPLIKKGNSLTLKNEKEQWNIDHVHDKSICKGDLNTAWHVGGL